MFIPQITQSEINSLQYFLKYCDGTIRYGNTTAQKSTSLTYIHQDYRKRLGIEREGRWCTLCLSNHAVETSYRLKKRMGPTWSQTPGRMRTKPLCGIRTTTKKPTLRLLFLGISFLLVNIWINILWRKISRPRRGAILFG